ncbi:MAG: sensor histidine kinase, partial [Cetobacterium sp.]|uniref:sensor histidine kinase n=1 Tax=Cetobacterium sp. TaxID=2071632 RepID=UPI003F385C7A
DIDLKIFDLFISGDLNLLKIAINNLVQNMLKYSPEDSTIFITFENNIITFKNPIYFNKVININEIFEPFQRGENAFNENIDGSGLGLSLVKKILQLHKFQFDLAIENSSFIFNIDIKKTD